MRATEHAGTFTLAAGLTLLTRLPFLGPGYGLDADAWRVAWAARVVATSGRYEASRFPGFPLHELGSALLVAGGPLALTGATALFSALAAGCFALVVRRLGGRDAVLAAIALASAPALFAASVQALDHAWGLAFALAGLALSLSGRAAMAGVAVGLAAGCRLTQLAWLVPIVLLLAGPSPAVAARGRTARFALTAFGVALACWLPPILTYGAGFLRVYEHGYPSLAIVGKNLTLDLLGVPGTLALGCAAAVALARPVAPGASAVPGARGRRTTVAALAGAAPFVAGFLRLPHESAYLIPALPLLLLALGARLGPVAWRLVLLALVASPWVLDVSQPVAGVARDRGVVRFGTGARAIELTPLRGPVPAQHAARARAMRELDRALAAAARLAGEHVVVASEWLPLVRVRLQGKQQGGVRYTYLLSRAERDSLRAAGIPIHAMSGAEWNNVAQQGVSLWEAGAQPLP